MHPHTTPMAGASGPLVTGTFDVANKGADMALSNGNMSAQNNNATLGNWEGTRATSHHSSGKWYFEVTNTSPVHGDTGYMQAGLCDTSFTPTVTGSYLSQNAHGAAAWSDGSLQQGGTSATGTPVYANTSTSPHTICIAVDLDAQLMWVSLPGGTWNLGSGNPATGANGFSISGFTAGSDIYPAVTMAGTSSGTKQMSCTINLGGATWQGTPPSGFQPWG